MTTAALSMKLEQVPALNKKEEYEYKRLITSVKDRPGHDRRYAIDCTKIKRELGWVRESILKWGLIELFNGTRETWSG